jgi:hypothetical protein
MTDTLRKFENAENAEAVNPPPLTGIGAKLNPSWMRQVLTQSGRARPWMGLRMPQFGEGHVGHLPEELAALDGVDPSIKEEPPAFNTAYVEAGRHLVGKKAFGCIACHDIAGVAASGTRGPDLALMQQRVRYSWYRRWMEQPQRMQPGTRMPTVFAEGRTLLDDVLGGRADAQADAVWVYLSIGSNLPLPEGLEPPKGLALTVKDRPIILRTFMPDAGSRAIAVGYPNNVSVAFDSATCRLAYVWSGNFLDASPVWNDRGGNPAKILGLRFWESPRGFPWAFTANGATPDFAAQARDPALAGPLPEGQLYTGPKRLFFVGYQTDPSGDPIFRYRVALAENTSAEVSEQFTPLRRPAAVGLVRRFLVTQPTGVAPWLLAGDSTTEPRVFDSSGNEVSIDLKTGDAEAAAAGRSVVFGQGESVTVLQAVTAPENTSWHLHRQGNGWQISIHWPSQGQASESPLIMQIWRPYRNEASVIRELVTTTKGSK